MYILGIVQFRKSSSAPMQGTPPCDGVGLTHCRVLLCLPSPLLHSVDVHCSHDNQDDHPPLT